MSIPSPHCHSGLKQGVKNRRRSIRSKKERNADLKGGLFCAIYFLISLVKYKYNTQTAESAVRTPANIHYLHALTTIHYLSIFFYAVFYLPPLFCTNHLLTFGTCLLLCLLSISWMVMSAESNWTVVNVAQNSENNFRYNLIYPARKKVRTYFQYFY